MGLVHLLCDKFGGVAYNSYYDHILAFEQPSLLIITATFLFVYLRKQIATYKKDDSVIINTAFNSVQKDLLLQEKKSIFPEQEVNPPFSNFKPTKIYLAFGGISMMTFLIAVLMYN